MIYKFNYKAKIIKVGTKNGHLIKLLRLMLLKKVKI
jgi:hypothetical protein